MRVDPHDAQQLQGEVNAAKQQLAVATLECEKARARLAVLHSRLDEMRHRDAQYWNEIERAFLDGTPSSDDPDCAPVVMEIEVMEE